MLVLFGLPFLCTSHLSIKILLSASLTCNWVKVKVKVKGDSHSQTDMTKSTLLGASPPRGMLRPKRRSKQPQPLGSKQALPGLG